MSGDREVGTRRAVWSDPWGGAASGMAATPSAGRLRSDAVTVVGAGPAGLACAIVLARGGRRVVVHERHGNVSHRFHGDFQGLESWSDDVDVLDELAGAGIRPTFEHHPVTEVTAFDGWGETYRIRSARPLYYLVRRGPDEGSLDRSLLEQARAAGVSVRLGSALRVVSGPTVLATGPAQANVMAVGYLFETDMPDGQWVCFSDRLAPGGYAYLLVQGGRGTLAICLFRSLTRSSEFLERTVEFFSARVGLAMREPRVFGGAGNYGVPCRGEHEGHLLVGEHAGFQDALAGFGMRYAVRSGALAARSLLKGQDYDSLWRGSLLPAIREGIGNRLLYVVAGDRGRRAMLRRMAAQDARVFLAGLYRPSRWGGALYPLASLHNRVRRRRPGCCGGACTCVRCRCEGRNGERSRRSG